MGALRECMAGRLCQRATFHPNPHALAHHLRHPDFHADTYAAPAGQPHTNPLTCSNAPTIADAHHSYAYDR